MNERDDVKCRLRIEADLPLLNTHHQNENVMTDDFVAVDWDVKWLTWPCDGSTTDIMWHSIVLFTPFGRRMIRRRRRSLSILLFNAVFLQSSMKFIIVAAQYFVDCPLYDVIKIIRFHSTYVFVCSLRWKTHSPRVVIFLSSCCVVHVKVRLWNLSLSMSEPSK